MEKKLITITIAFLVIAGIFTVGYVVLNPNDKINDDEQVEVIELGYQMIDKEKGDMTLITRTFDFVYDNKQWHIVASVPKYRYDNYVNEKYLVYWTNENWYEPTEQRGYIEDEYLQDIVEQFKTQNGKLTDQELVNVIAYFVQSQIIYQDDRIQYENEYNAYPMQTLINGKGDCDCKAVLLVGLLYHAGYECIYIQFLPQNISDGHVIVGINSEDYISKDKCRYLLHDSKKYYLIDTTAVLPVGEIMHTDNEVHKLRTVHEYGKRTMFEYDEIVFVNDFLAK